VQPDDGIHSGDHTTVPGAALMVHASPWDRDHNLVGHNPMPAGNFLPGAAFRGCATLQHFVVLLPQLLPRLPYALDPAEDILARTRTFYRSCSYA